MSARLKSISVSNFRSIRGDLTLELDAPTVLIHGQNGAGKTSLLSAIELGLTGAVPSMGRLDPDYISHIVHKDSDEARVSVLADLTGSGDQRSEMIVRDGQLSGKGLLPRSSARFYTERTYLAQSTLGRLLEIYEQRDASRSDSPLTVFVKDLLGLDQLDDLIEGLHTAGDKRRIKTAVPLYGEIEDEMSLLTREIEKISQETGELDTQINEIEASLAERLRELEITEPKPPTALLEILKDQPEESELQRLSRLRRDITSSLEQWQSLRSPVEPDARGRAEAALAKANTDVEAWRSRGGDDLLNLLESVSDFVASLTPVASIGPEHAWQEALRVVREDLARCTTILEGDAQDTARRSAIDQDLARGRARAAVLDDQINGLSGDTEALARALASLLPHVHSEVCPVCSRDYSEESEEPLRAHISSRISSLTERAGQLKALTAERADTSRALADAERERARIVSRELTPERRTELKTRSARLQEFSRALGDHEATALHGPAVLDAASSASQHLNRLRARDQAASSMRSASVRFADVLGLPPVEDSESFEAALERFRGVVADREGTLIARQSARRAALAIAREHDKLMEERRRLDERLANNDQHLNRLTEAKNGADARIGQVRRLRKLAQRTRTAIVRKVFNESLNAMWRDLFVRLAPDERFIPAFALPETQGGPVEAVLETRYRDGRKGGNPRAMLSAGNLNTAALTLFLALHLSVSPTLPWLVIDDPVQSMDEVHIAQLAALLRTLSRQHKRQVIIAVHEKPLFDYLSLELSPASRRDRLITIELGRGPDGKTVSEYQQLIWQPDRAIAA